MDDRRYHGLHWEDGEARLKGFSATSRGKSTILKIELEVFGAHDSWALAHMLRSLQQAQQPAKPADVAPKSRSKGKADDLLALPAPLLKITDRRNG